MSNLVLVHGAWHGGWCWRKVAPLLQAAGHNVLTPTLTGLGERVHLAHPGIDVSTHATDIVNVIDYEDLDDVTLIGHSYAGMVITAVAERVPNRLRQLVFLDAFLPEDGACLLDHVPPDLVAAVRAATDEAGDGWRVPPLFEQLGLTDPADIAWVQSKLTFQPLRTQEEPIRRLDPQAAGLPRSYLYCTEGGFAPLFAQFAQQARQHGLRYTELATGHDMMITAPSELATLLDQWMTPPGPS